MPLTIHLPHPCPPQRPALVTRMLLLPALAAVGLGERLHHYPAQLSGGEQQRVAIARALVPNPAILVADEPTGNLDEGTGSSIIDLLFALKAERGATLVLVTHDLSLARRCDRTIRLRSGRIEADAIAPAPVLV